MRPPLSRLSSALLLCLPALAAAAPTPVALGFEDRTAEVACADEAALRARVIDLVQGPAFDPRAARRATVRVDADGDRRTARVRVVEGARVLGDRSIETVRGDCPALLASVALSLVLVIDPVRGVALMHAPQPPLAPSGAGEVTEAPTAPVETPHPSAPAEATARPPLEPRPAAPAPPPRTAWTVDGALLASVGATPGFGGGWLIGGGLRRPRWGLAVEARLQPPSTVTHGGGRVAAALFSGGLRLCGRHPPVELCAVGHVGLQPVRGRGFDHDRSATAEVAFVGARLGVALPLLDRWALRAALELDAPLGTTALRVDGALAWQNPPLAGALLLGLGRSWR